MRHTVTIREHQSWVQVPAEDVSVGTELVVCTDGKAIGRNEVEAQDIRNDAVRVGVPTRWVLGEWFAGALDPYRSPDRWSVVFRSRSQRRASEVGGGGAG